MDIKMLSEKYQVRKLCEDHIPEILALCQGNPMYYQYCPPAITEEGVRFEMTVLPPGKTADEKFYIGFFEKNRLIAVMDLIDGYPQRETAYIGFFMMTRGVSGQGVGTKIIGDACRYLKTAGYETVQLGYVKGNPQSERFWLKNQFVKTGIETVTDRYVAVRMERRL